MAVLNGHRRGRLPGHLVAAVAVAAAAVGCGGSGSGTASGGAAARHVRLDVAQHAGLGQFLVSDGRTLYMYPPDRQRAVTCTTTDGCEQAWPPLFVASGSAAAAGPGVKQSLIGSLPGDGGRIVTYNNWPLYYYAGDRNPGEVNGQDQGFNWFVVAPDGVPIKTGPVS